MEVFCRSFCMKWSEVCYLGLFKLRYLNSKYQPTLETLEKQSTQIGLHKILQNLSEVTMPQKKIRTGLKRHHWTVKETKIYLQYLQKHEGLFVDYITRKNNRVFLSISRAIKSRKSHQVKSHHQKLLAKYGSIANIVAFLRQIQEVFDESPSTEPPNDSQSMEDPQSSQSQPLSEPEQLEPLSDKKSEFDGYKTRIYLEAQAPGIDEEDDIFKVLDSFGGQFNFQYQDSLLLS